MELLERASQLRELNSALGQVKAREGQGCVALVYGEAGIGKTSLVEQFIKENKKSWRILQGACDSLFTPRPLGPLYDIALQISGDLPALLNSESSRGQFSPPVSTNSKDKRLFSSLKMFNGRTKRRLTCSNISDDESVKLPR